MRIKGDYVKDGKIRIGKDTLDGASIQYRWGGEWQKNKLYVRSAKESVATNAAFMAIEGTYATIIHVTVAYVQVRLDIHVAGLSMTSKLPVYKGTSTTVIRLNRSTKK